MPRPFWIVAGSLGIVLIGISLRLRQPGDYPFVTHAFADATKGDVGVLRAVPPGGKAG